MCGLSFSILSTQVMCKGSYVPLLLLSSEYVVRGVFVLVTLATDPSASALVF